MFTQIPSHLHWELTKMFGPCTVGGMTVQQVKDAMHYLEVGFVQMLKPSCGLFTYFLLLRGGLETWTTRKALNLLVMFGALSMSSLGQSELGRFSLAGVVVLLSSQLANALYAVSLQRILQRIGASFRSAADTVFAPGLVVHMSQVVLGLGLRRRRMALGRRVPARGIKIKPLTKSPNR